MTLEDEEVLLRPFERGDVAAIVAACQDSEIPRWTSVPASYTESDALAWLDCEVRERYPAGTHAVYIGEVVASGVPRPDEPPLIYWNRGYRKLRLHEEPLP